MNRYWLQVLTTLSVLWLACSPLLYAKEKVEVAIKSGDLITILADKGLIDISKNIRQAVGNVIITHQSEALYGEKATINTLTGDAEVEGNVRYVASDVTLYGTKLNINFKSGLLVIQNGRILTNSLAIVGQQLSKIDKETFIGNDSEFSTCQDCPESWTISGKEVRLVMEKYVYVTHAFIKVKGTVVLYLPYFVFPVKKRRETGVLFPKIGYQMQQGFYYQQPWFWAISNQKDMTISPAVWGRRGVGGEAQYREVFTSDNWLEVDSLNANDKVYQPKKSTIEQSGVTEFRSFSDFESHYHSDNGINGHIYLTHLTDLDISRDYAAFSQTRITGPVLENSAVLEERNSLFTISNDIRWGRSLIYDDAKGFDHSLVQRIPSLRVSSRPVFLFNTEIPLLHSAYFQFDGGYDYFKQDHITSDGTFYRNAHRINYAPKFVWNMGHIGPVKLTQQTTYDGQYYNFYNNKTYFKKSAFLLETEAEITFSKIFGAAYNAPSAKPELISLSSEVIPKKESDLIGEIPNPEVLKRAESGITHSSYKHQQSLKLRHYATMDRQFSGDLSFKKQISAGEGAFDFRDRVLEDEYQISQAGSVIKLPLDNTVEITWHNYLTKKTPNLFDPMVDGRFLRDNFTYSEVGSFYLSQGIDIKRRANTDEALTRLNVGANYSWDLFSWSTNEYYFYQRKAHLTTMVVSFSPKYSTVSISYNYDSFSIPINKFLRSGMTIRPIDLFYFQFSYDYDLERKVNTQNRLGFIFLPRNNCWKISLERQKDEIETKYSFNFFKLTKSGTL